MPCASGKKIFNIYVCIGYFVHEMLLKWKIILQVVEDGYEFFAKRQLVTLFSAPNYCGEFDNAGAMMSVDETLMCSFQILKPADKRKFTYGGLNAGRPVTPPRGANNKNKKK